MQCLSLLRERIPVRISLADFFEKATVAEQAALIRSRLRPDNLSPADSTVSWELELLQKAGSPAVDETIPPRDRSLPRPLSPNQQRVWFMEQAVAGKPVYNEAEAVRLRGELNVEVLETAGGTSARQLVFKACRMPEMTVRSQADLGCQSLRPLADRFSSWAGVGCVPARRFFSAISL